MFLNAMSMRSIIWTLRRYSLRHIWYRIRLKKRRQRWRAERQKLSERFKKNTDIIWRAGPALIIGHFDDVHGLSRGATYDLEEIKKKHQNFQIWNIADIIRNKKSHIKNVPKNLNFDVIYFLCQPDNYATILEHIDPNEIKHSYRIGRWAWETTIFPSAWTFACEIVHEVWAPSKFCADVFETQMPGKVSIYPHPITVSPHVTSNARKLLNISDSAFVGLCIMDIQSCPERKNPWAHIIAWRNAFRKDNNAIMILKIRFGKRTSFVLKEIRELIGGSKNFIIISDDVSSDFISDLQNSCDVFLSLHRSEGFGLNILECLMLGKKVIATNWSANSEYGPNFENYIGIPFNMIPYQDCMLHYEDHNFSWADPVIQEASSVLLKLRDSTQFN